MWVFGYGSLIWKVDFPYEECRPGFIRGFVRRFWQGSTDHRGTPSSPGCVVTLIPFQSFLKSNDEFKASTTDAVWGMAYRLADSECERILAHLDYREKDGYAPFHVAVYSSDRQEEEPMLTNVLMYVANDSNPSYVGHEPVDLLADRILYAKGDSGWNVEYVLGLCKAHQDAKLKVRDSHLEALEKRLVEGMLAILKKEKEHPFKDILAFYAPAANQQLLAFYNKDET